MKNKANQVIDMIAEAYIMTYGQEKWNSLTDEQKRTVVMTIAQDLMK